MSARKVRLHLERLEDRLTPSWAGVPPATIPVPRGPLVVTLDAQGDASGTGTNFFGENDYIRFTARRSGQHVFTAGADNSEMDTVIGVFNAAGKRLGYNDDISRIDFDSRLSLNLVAGKVYFFGITRYSGNEGGDFVWAIDGPGTTPAPTPSPTPDPTPSPTGSFQITLRFGTGLTASQQAIFRQAAARWERAIVGDLPNATYQGRAVDDVLIDASGARIDGASGILGQAGPDAYRSGSRLPIHGEMEFDTADLASLERDGGLLDTITHEMGHVLGVGTIWSARGLLAGAGTATPRFTGANAVREYSRLLGRNVNSVPVENGGGAGTRDSHWDDEVFNNELMTGYLNSGERNPLSRMTIASMADLGYQVNLDAGEAYSLPNAARASAVRAVLPQPAAGASVVANTPARPRLDAAQGEQLICRPSDAATVDELFATR